MTEQINGNRVTVCDMIAQVLMPDQMFKQAFDEIGLAYMCQDETMYGVSTFMTQMVIRFKAGEVEIEFENEQRCLERLVYKQEESYSGTNSVLVDKIYQDMFAKGFKTNYISTVQAIVITYFAR